MNGIVSFITMALVAFTVENAILTRGLGINKMFIFTLRYKTIFLYAILVISVGTVSSMFTYFLSKFFNYLELAQFYRPIFYLLIITAIYVLMHYIILKNFPKLYEMIRYMLPFSVFNSATLGAVLLSQNSSTINTFAKSVGFSFGTSFGIVIVYLIMLEAKKQLSITNTAPSFKGLPISLLYVGILSMVFFGLSGHQLPI